MPLALVANAALMCGAWFLLPLGTRQWLFTLHGPLAFPVVLSSWMIADTPATNVLADQDTDSDVVAGDERCRRWLAARSVALTALVAPPCVAVALALGALYGQWPQVVLACLAVVAGPLGVLPLAAWLGLILPYRPQPLTWRWGHRRAWSTQVRWALLVVAPYVLVPGVSAVLVVPALLVEHTLAQRTLDLSPAGAAVVGSTLVVTLIAAAVVGVAGGACIACRRHDALATFLAEREGTGDTTPIG